MEKRPWIALLLDFYGELLTERQKGLMKLYYEEDLSFGEIAENLQISRQAVFDQIKRGEKSLYHLEEKVGLAKRFLEERTRWRRFTRELQAIETSLDSGQEADRQAAQKRLRALREDMSSLLAE
ncbi:MAG: YlxM family DNA-binding protein [Firmicutes bacterium]|nr:YlxM family DNA-binding protein [Bacillota bacterium]MCL5038404.1 YlxM family DNA-binding protein [Bacillota bacterium]